MSSNEKWDRRFLELASHIGEWSKDPSTKVGAVIVDNDRRIVSTGYNGFPKNVVDDEQKLNNRDVKYEMIIHGEINAILFAQRSLKHCTLYTTPFMPCSRCASIIVQSGINRVVAPNNFPERWAKQFDTSIQIFKESNVTVDFYD